MANTLYTVAEYWPNPGLANTLTLAYFNADGTSANVSSSFSFDPSTYSIVEKDYVDDKWADTWYIRYDPVRGVVEWRDDNPIQLGLVKRLVYRTGSEILWGSTVRLGETVTNQPIIDYSRSAWAAPFVTGPWAYGWQAVTFTDRHAVYNGFADVLEFEYAQTWNGTTRGAIYRCARGLGPIEIQWTGYTKTGKVVTPPIHATVTRTA